MHFIVGLLQSSSIYLLSMKNNDIACIANARTETWWQKLHASKLAQKVQPNFSADVVLLGDSIIQEWEVSGADAWQYFFGETKHNKQAFNLGFGGDCTDHLLWRIQNGALDKLNCKHVLLQIGTNNLGHKAQSPEDVSQGVSCILQEIRCRLPHAKIILMALFPRSANPKKRLRIAIDNTNVLLEKLADNKHIVWLNINSQLLTPDGILETSIMPDLLHPNAEQYYKWAQALTPFFV